jgi:hypothetical protein
LNNQDDAIHVRGNQIILVENLNCVANVSGIGLALFQIRFTTTNEGVSA